MRCRNIFRFEHKIQVFPCNTSLLPCSCSAIPVLHLPPVLRTSQDHPTLKRPLCPGLKSSDLRVLLGPRRLLLVVTTKMARQEREGGRLVLTFSACLFRTKNFAIFDEKRLRECAYSTKSELARHVRKEICLKQEINDCMLPSYGLLFSTQGRGLFTSINWTIWCRRQFSEENRLTLLMVTSDLALLAVSSQ